jgi:hypothetical protein
MTNQLLLTYKMRISTPDYTNERKKRRKRRRKKRCNTPSPLRLGLSLFFFYNKIFAKIHKVYQSN